jgi:hypothetical protein
LDLGLTDIRGNAACDNSDLTVTTILGSETITRGVLARFILELLSVNEVQRQWEIELLGRTRRIYLRESAANSNSERDAEMVSGILFPASTEPGTYAMTFIEVSGSLTNTATTSFTVEEQLLTIRVRDYRVGSCRPEYLRFSARCATPYGYFYPYKMRIPTHTKLHSSTDAPQLP